MNYFEFYGVPESFQPDLAVIKAKFYAFSKQYHPDFYVNASEEKQADILELSTLNNNAWKVLSDARQRIEYVLGLHGLADEKYKLPIDFLAEMMELNEGVMELELEPDAGKTAALKAQTGEIKARIAADLQTLFDAYDAQPSGQEDLLLSVRDLWYRQKYLFRLDEAFNKLP